MNMKLILNLKKRFISRASHFIHFYTVKNEPQLPCRSKSKILLLLSADGSDISEAVG